MTVVTLFLLASAGLLLCLSVLDAGTGSASAEDHGSPQDCRLDTPPLDTGDIEAISSGLSHGVRSPLGAIVSYVALILETDGQAISRSSREYLERIAQIARGTIDSCQDLALYMRLTLPRAASTPTVAEALDDVQLDGDTPEPAAFTGERIAIDRFALEQLLRLMRDKNGSRRAVEQLQCTVNPSGSMLEARLECPDGPFDDLQLIDGAERRTALSRAFDGTGRGSIAILDRAARNLGGRAYRSVNSEQVARVLLNVPFATRDNDIT